LATPAATVPTPTSLTSFTLTRASGLHVLQIVNELRQILDGINIMMRRRRDQPDARRAVADLADVFVDLVPGQLPAFAGLGALGHLDLQLLGVDQIFGGDAEAGRGHLLDGAAAPVAVGVALEALGVFAAFAGVALAADAVHGDGQIFVRFLADRAEAHRAGDESLDDFLGRLDFLERNRRCGLLKFSRPRIVQRCGFVVDQLGVFLERRISVDAHGLLQLGDGVGVPHVVFAVAPPLILPAVFEHFAVDAIGGEAVAMPPGFAGDHVQIDAVDPAGGAGEIFVDDGRCSADRFENLRAAIALHVLMPILLATLMIALLAALM
jgi:hypothetical protein